MPHSLLVVSHSPSPNTLRLTGAVKNGACTPGFGVSVEVLSPFNTRAEHVLGADAIIIGTTENFGYMSGALKDFFDRIYYPCLGVTEALPYALFIKGGLDGTGARSSVERIISGLKWKCVQEPIVMKGAFQNQWIAPLEQLGLAMTAGLDAGVF